MGAAIRREWDAAILELTALAVERYASGLEATVEQIDVIYDPDERCYHANLWWLGMARDEYPSRINLDLPAGLDPDDIEAALSSYPSRANH